MELTLQREDKLEEIGKILAVNFFSLKQEVGKKTLFLNLLLSAEGRKYIGVDLDFFNPLDLKKYTKRVITWKDLINLNFKIWRVKERLFAIRQILEDCVQRKIYLMFINFPVGISEDFLKINAFLKCINVYVDESNEKAGFRLMRAFNWLKYEKIDINGVIECFVSEKKYLKKIADKLGVDYLGFIPFDEKVKNNLVYKGSKVEREWEKIWEKLNSKLL